MVAYTVEGSNKVFSTWTDAKNHAATVVARRKTDSKVSIKRNGEPYGEMWRQNGKIKYTTPCKPHTMAIPAVKPKDPVKKKEVVRKNTEPKGTVKKKTTKKTTETPVKATKTVKTVSTTTPKPKKPSTGKEPVKKSKPKATPAPRNTGREAHRPRPEPREPVRERRYEPAPELLGPGAQKRVREPTGKAPALPFPTLSWEEGKTRREENRAKREERRQEREDRKFLRQQRRAEREIRKHIYVDEPDDPEPDGARARDRGDDTRRRAGEGSKAIIPARRPLRTVEAPAEIEAPKERGIARFGREAKALPPPRSDTTTATAEDGTTYEVEIIPPKRDRRRAGCPNAATAPPRWGWRPHPSPISAGCSWRRWRARRTPPSKSTRASARGYSRERSCASATCTAGGSRTGRSAPSSPTDPSSGGTDRAPPPPNPFPNPFRSHSGA